MCGIVGVTGSDDALEVLFAGLEVLEYRGYDSAGVALCDAEYPGIYLEKAAEAGRSIEKLRSAAGGAPRRPGASLGHTRWATHGTPSERNAHPHLDCTKRIALVHNGVIGNHRRLAAELESAGHTLVSETDSEVVVHLVEAEVGGGASLFEAVRAVVGRLSGDFALALVSADEPDVVVAARRTSPLVVGIAPGRGFVASDLAALLGRTRELFELADGEVAEVRPGSLVVVDASGAAVEPHPLEVTWDVSAAQKGGFADFMSKEIREQPVAVEETLVGRVGADGSTEFEELVLSPEQLAGFSRVVLVACGSSYHACLAGRSAIERMARLPAEVDIASEFRYRSAVLGSDALVLAVSQSGETVDTLHALREARSLGATTIAVTNVVGSVMAREADGVLYTHAGPEIGVASTKCHLAQLALLQSFALHVARARRSGVGVDPLETATELRSLPHLLKSTLGRIADYERTARRFVTVRDFYYLGRGAGFPVALEGALKLKELAYVRAEAYAAGEMKHGPISLIEPGALVVVVATRGALWEKVMGNVAEMKARGATVLAVAEDGDEETASAVDDVLRVPRSGELSCSLIDVVPLQCFAYAIASYLGHDVDRPRNLAKVVTVE